MVVLHWSQSMKGIRDLVRPVPEWVRMGVGLTKIDEKVVIDLPSRQEAGEGEGGIERGVDRLIAVSVMAGMAGMADMAGRGENRMEGGVIEVDRGVDIRIKVHEMVVEATAAVPMSMSMPMVSEWEVTISVVIEIEIQDRQYPLVQPHQHPYNHQHPHHSVDYRHPHPVSEEVEVP